MATCDRMVEGNMVSFMCPLEQNHDGPCATPESARSQREREKWLKGQERQQAQDTLAEFQGPAKTTAQSLTENPSPPPGYRNCSNCKAKGCEDCNQRGYIFGERPEPSQEDQGRVRSREFMDCSLECEDRLGHTGRVGCVLAEQDHSSTCTQGPNHDGPCHPTEPEPTKQRDGDQPLPQVHEGGYVQDRIIAAMEESKRVGTERYGTPLQTFNGRDALQDAVEEARDLYVYLTSLQMAREVDRQRLVDVVSLALLTEWITAAEDDRKDTPEGHTARLAEVAVDAILKATGGVEG